MHKKSQSIIEMILQLYYFLFQPVKLCFFKTKLHQSIIYLC